MLHPKRSPKQMKGKREKFRRHKTEGGSKRDDLINIQIERPIGLNGERKPS